MEFVKVLPEANGCFAGRDTRWCWVVVRNEARVATPKTVFAYAARNYSSLSAALLRKYRLLPSGCLDDACRYHIDFFCAAITNLPYERALE